jgi:hypothetical protein
MGLGAPPTVAHGEPQLAVIPAERDKAFGSTGEGGDLERVQE